MPRGSVKIVLLANTRQMRRLQGQKHVRGVNWANTPQSGELIQAQLVSIALQESIAISMPHPRMIALHAHSVHTPRYKGATALRPVCNVRLARTRQSWGPAPTNPALLVTRGSILQYLRQRQLMHAWIAMLESTPCIWEHLLSPFAQIAQQASIQTCLGPFRRAFACRALMGTIQARRVHRLSCRAFPVMRASIQTFWGQILQAFVFLAHSERTLLVLGRPNCHDA